MYRGGGAAAGGVPEGLRGPVRRQGGEVHRPGARPLPVRPAGLYPVPRLHGEVRAQEHGAPD